MKFAGCFCVALAGAASLLPLAYAQGEKKPWEEYENRVDAARTITALGPDLVGDRVDLSTGALSFSVTDVSIPGNNALPVAFTRTFSVSNRRYYKNDAPLADWDIDLPKIGGVFAEHKDYPRWSTLAGDSNRCSSENVRPPNSLGVDPSEYWQGNQLSIPGVGSGELLRVAPGIQVPTDGRNYRWFVDGQIFVACIPSVQQGVAGEGFLAITPDGTTYKFDWMGATHVPDLAGPTYIDEWDNPVYSSTKRAARALYATEVTDRFGNTVNYTYTNGPDDPIQLVRIESSDHVGPPRVLTINYQGGLVSSVVEASGGLTRQWSYLYTTIGSEKTLHRVTRPDQSTWEINLGALSRAKIDHVPGTQEVCELLPAYIPPDSFSGSVTHPSGATVAFTVDIKTFGRTNVPLVCENFSHDRPQISNEYARFPIQFHALALVRKSISGPALTSMEWNYEYSSPGTFYRPTGDTRDRRCPSGMDCEIPVCTGVSVGSHGKACDLRNAQTTVTTRKVGDPINLEWVRYHHGSSFHYDEGKLLRVESGTGPTNILREDTNTYDLHNFGRTSQTRVYPLRFGSSLRPQGFTSEFHRPLKETMIAQQGEVFSRTVTSFDTMARPLTVVRASTLGDIRTDQTVYHDRPAKWVMGQVRSVTNLDKNVVTLAMDYDEQWHLPTVLRVHGRVAQRYTYHQNGLLHTVKDGLERQYALEDYFRGTPQTILMPGSTSLSAAVNARGDVTSVTDAMGYTTTYWYDPMRRVTRVRYPTGDAVAWTDTVASFSRAATPVGAELPATLWRQHVATGNHVTETFYDELWRPLMTIESDAGSTAQRYTVRRFDHAGREVFSSYPSATLLNFATASEGVSHLFDALGRPTLSKQTSELSQDLMTVTEYLSGFQKRVTNPRSHSTTFSYQAFDQPDESAPTLIAAPEGQNTEIVRDVLGKPLSIRRFGSWSGGSVSVSRAYVYDQHERLCKSIEPESRATVFQYDAANNLTWSAEGLSLFSEEACDREAVPSSARVVRTYDERNRPWTVTYPDHGQDLTFTYFADGALKTAAAGNVFSSYEYNRRRQLTSEQRTIDGQTYPVGYEYNALGHLSAMTYPDGNRTIFSPNAMGQPTRVGSLATEVKYSPTGSVESFFYGNGIAYDSSNNARQLPDSLTYSGDGLAIFSQFQAYDAAANPTSSTDIRPGEGVRSRTMTYDGLDRLTSAEAQGLWGTEGFVYDPLDNIRSVVRSTETQARTYNYNQENLLATVRRGIAPVVALGYDTRGNVIERNGTTLNFDRANRLRGFGAGVGYDYDAQGLRARRVEGGTTTHFVYTLDGRLVWERRMEPQTYTRHHFLGSRLIARADGSSAPPAGAPSLTLVEASNNGNYSVSWGTIATTTYYELYERPSGGNWSLIHSDSTASKSISGKPDGTWQYQVRACNVFGCTSYSAVKAITVTRPPSTAPTLVAPTTNYSGNFTVSWNSVSGASEYRLQEKLGTDAWSTIDPITNGSTEMQITGKSSGVWSYRINACNDGGCSTFSSATATTVTLAPSTAPTLTAPATNYSGNFTVSWNAIAGASYTLEERLGSGAWGNPVNIGQGITSRQITDRSSGIWRYRINACNAGGCSTFSSATATTVTLAPSTAPTLAAPATSYDGNFTLSWTAIAGATYTLQEKFGSGAWGNPVNIDQGITSRQVTGRSAGIWRYQINACNDGGCSPFSTATATTVTLPPTGKPTVTAPAQGSIDGFTISWSSVTAAEDYRVEESKDNGPWQHRQLSSSRTFSTGARMKGSYRFRVRAENVAGPAPSYSDTATVEVPDPPAGLPAPTVVTVGQMCEVAWQTSATATRYELRRNSAATVYSGPNTHYSEAGACTMHFEVQACGLGGCSAWSPPGFPSGGGGGPPGGPIPIQSQPNEGGDE